MNKIPHKILLLLSSLFFLSSLSNKLLFNEIDLITKIDCTVDDSDVYAAVDLWISDQATAEATYGHIGTWNFTSGRSKTMPGLFGCCGTDTYRFIDPR